MRVTVAPANKRMSEITVYANEGSDPAQTIVTLRNLVHRQRQAYDARIFAAGLPGGKDGLEQQDAGTLATEAQEQA